jgi:SigmaW regulon antibacterial
LRDLVAPGARPPVPSWQEPPLPFVVAAPSLLHTTAFVNQRAISAGALIALACDTVIMTKGATTSAATPMAVALEQEMRARVVEAEAEVPRAMAEAFRQGNLGIMDYYRMKNIQADSSMRESIADGSKDEPTPPVVSAMPFVEP